MKINRNKNNINVNPATTNSVNDVSLQKMKELIDEHRERIYQELNEEYMKSVMVMSRPKPLEIKIKERELEELDHLRMKVHQSSAIPKNIFVDNSYETHIDKKFRDDEDIKRRWERRRIKRNLDEILNE